MALANGWKWIPLSEDGGMDGSAVTKVFKASEHHSAADLLAREVIQNSWDAATLLRKQIKNPKLEFSVEFKFVTLTGKAKAQFIKDASLVDLKNRVTLLPKSQASKNLQMSVKDLESNKPLRLLYCIDKGGHGLFGHPSKKKASILYRALYQFGGTTKDAGESSGGSFGFGKSAFVRGSNLRTVFAYSSFSKQVDDSVTRRLVGFTWWEGHSLKNDDFDGRAIFGELKQGDGPRGLEKVVPFEDLYADKIAERLSFPRRTADMPENYGASLLLVDPTVTALELKDSAERYWWPALIELGLNFSIDIIDEDGNKLTPRPRQNKFVQSFLPIYALATGESKPVDTKREQRYILNSQLEKDIGGLAFKVQEGDALEIPDPETGLPKMSKVALIRSPRMVIEYKDLGARRIPFHGVFVASSSVDNLLRETENAEHNTWTMKDSADISAEATAIARSVGRGISSNANKFMNDVDPPPPKENASLAHFANLLSPFLKGTIVGPTPPPSPKSEPVEIRFKKGPELAVVADQQLCTSATFTVLLSEKAKMPEVPAVISVDFKILEEDGEAGSEWAYVLSTKSKTSDFDKNELEQWVGTLRKGSPIEFTFRSAPYDMNWSGQLRVLVDMAEISESEDGKKN